MNVQTINCAKIHFNDPLYLFISFEDDSIIEENIQTLFCLNSNLLPYSITEAAK